MTTPTVTAAGLALLLAAVPATAQPFDEDLATPAPPAAVDVLTPSTSPEELVVPDEPAGEDPAETAPEPETELPESVAPESTPVEDEAAETETDATPDTDATADGADDGVLTPTDETASTETPGSTSDQGDLSTPGTSANPVESTEGAEAEAEATVADVAPRLVVTPGYHEDGYDRPFWWGEDGLHFRDPIPANGYVNINVPGANNVSIDSHRELIGQTFIPWSYFNLQPGMCISWTESNGFSYHFGEDNSGRGGVDEKDWEFCVPGSTDPDEPVVPDPDEPDQPDVPDPDEPDVPDVPGDPDQPVEPDTPSTPDSPDVPDQPQTPAEPVTPAGPDASTEVPESTLPVAEVPLSTASESVPAADTTATAATDAETATPGALAVTGLGAGAKSLLAAAAALGIGGGLMALASKTKQR